MEDGDAIGKSLMHADDDGDDGGIFGVGGENVFEPRHLIAVELVGGCVVEIDEVNASALPVIVDVETMVFWVITQPLLLEFWRVDPIGKLDEIVGASFRRIEFVIADAEIDGRAGEGDELVLDEVVPGIRFVIGDGRGLGGLLFVVLIKIGDIAKVAEMPVEKSLIVVGTGGDGGHNYVSAVAGIARDDEGPGLLGPGGGRDKNCEKKYAR